MNKIYPPQKFILEYLKTHTKDELEKLAIENYKRALNIEKNSLTYNYEVNALILINF